MIRVVLDSNIIISAILFGGLPETILKLAIEEEIKVIISREIISEVIGILGQKFGYRKQILEKIEDLLFITCSLITPKEKVKIIKNNPADNRILECGLSAKADYIISGDKKHLLPLRKYRGIEIISAKVFLGIIKESSFKKLMKNRRGNISVSYNQIKSDVKKAIIVIRQRKKY